MEQRAISLLNGPARKGHNKVGVGSHQSIYSQALNVWNPFLPTI